MEQTKAKNPFDNKSWIVFLAAFAALFIALSNRLGGTPVGVQVLFLLSQIAFVLPPGAALLLYLKPRLDGVRFGIASYLLGFCIILAEYFVFFAVGLKDHILICLIVVSALSIFCLVRKRAELRGMEWDNGGAWAFCALCAGLSLLVLFTALSCYNLPGNGSDLAYIYQDQAWNTGNVTSLASGMPVMDIHIDGFSFGYHYFASAFLAVFKNALGMSSYLLNLRMLPVVQAFVYAGGLYLLFTALFQNKWAAAGAAAIGVFSSALLLGHMLWYAYATVTGLGLALAAAFFFFRYLK